MVCHHHHRHDELLRTHKTKGYPVASPLARCWQSWRRYSKHQPTKATSLGWQRHCNHAKECFDWRHQPRDEPSLGWRWAPWRTEEYRWLEENYGISEEDDVWWQLTIQHHFGELPEEDRDDAEVMNFLSDDVRVEQFLRDLLRRYRSSTAIYHPWPTLQNI